MQYNENLNYLEETIKEVLGSSICEEKVRKTKKWSFEPL